MLCHFQGGSSAKLPGARAPSPAPVPPTPADPAPDPLAPVLAGLIGRQVAIFTDTAIHSGKLISSEPITLVGSAGQVTVVAGPAISVQY